MRILVTGATGLIGGRLVRALAGDGHEVTAVSRDPARALPLLPARCPCVAWNPATGSLDPDLLRNVDAIVHMAGESVAGGAWTRARKEAIRRSRVDGSRTLVRAIEALPSSARPRVLVSASAIGYYGDRGAAEIDESSPAGDGFLSDVCRQWEQEVFAAERLGLRTAAIRIGVVLAKQGGALRKMLLPFRLGLGGRLGSGRQWMSWIHLDDLVRLFRRVVIDDQLTGVINGVAPAPVTNADFTRALAHVLKRPALLPVPSAALRLTLGEMSTLLLASQRVLPRHAQRLGFTFWHTDVAETLAHICADLSEEVECEQWVTRSPGEAFPFFADARNLEAITPEFLRFRVRRVSTATMGEGTCIDYRLSLHGIPMRWRSRIERWEPERAFVDLQTRGPFKLWHHTHEFEPLAGGTVIRDRVRFELPFGALGALVGGGLVARDVAAIFAYRRARIDELFGNSGGRSRRAAARPMRKSVAPEAV